MFGKYLSTVFNKIPSTYTSVITRQLNQTGVPGPWSTIPIKRQVRNRFPRPNEVKRITTHGYEKRISTLHGRKVLWGRILRGRSILSH